MSTRKHIIELKDTSASEMARFRRIMLGIWRQQIEDDKNASEMERFINENIGSLIKKDSNIDYYTINDQSELTDPNYKYSGDFYSKDGRYLGNEGLPENKVYIVENDGYKIHNTGKGTAEIRMDKSKIT
ncbi:hypothetical protein, partial [[Flexibacter] sp. ATCC 35208]|uniref:hypothetical protein n=2 Tax=Bacteroidota TaxID=976 RepID=UPI0009C53F5C